MTYQTYWIKIEASLKIINNMDNTLNRNNTIIENVEYLDMDDPKNSWYFDAERFDVNFPLVRSYNGEPSYCHRDLFSEWYEYWDAVFSYYRNTSNISAICYVADTTNLDDPLERYYTDSSLRSRITDHFDYEFLFQSKQALPNGKKITYFLAGLKQESDLTGINERFYLKDGRYTSGMFRAELYPHIQLIISRDWDLLKRYFFFMIRNHQYKNSKFIYNIKEDSGNVKWHHFSDLSDAQFRSLPKDYRFNWRGYGNGASSVQVEDKVLTVWKKNHE